MLFCLTLSHFSRTQKEQLDKLNQSGEEVTEDTFADELMASVSRGNIHCLER